jgi:hypothetical protein
MNSGSGRDNTNKKEMNNADFPNLNMSIGEYYKILMEGKRPTRQRTVKEDQKMGAPPQLTRGASI